MKKDMTIRLYDSKEVGIEFKYSYEKPTKCMRKALLKFLDSELVPFYGYTYKLKEGVQLPKEFKLINTDVKPYGTRKDYFGTLIY